MITIEMSTCNLIRARCILVRCHKHLLPFPKICIRQARTLSLMRHTSRAFAPSALSNRFTSRIFCRGQHGKHNDNVPKNFIDRIRQLWQHLFGKYLLVTNTLGSGLLMVFGDIAAQEIEFRRRNMKMDTKYFYDFTRIWRMFIVGMLQGPLHHYVYIWLEKIMPIANLRTTLYKILIDELILSPICIVVFFYSACFLENKSFEETNEELFNKFIFIYCVDWTVWPAVQYINFRYLDLRYRVTYVNCCTALYNIFMSYIKHDDD